MHRVTLVATKFVVIGCQKPTSGDNPATGDM